ncbi:MAG: phosphate ABC transporter, permease protein PstA [Sulfurimonas sp. RIFOXYD12_FULL_33_39]|uniref:phosphate ABC transporter permease PstA n=1 Tax=unclassified Sulfurimonas TaxID=2623549 RepID=UPI0008B0013E|nr:MULTISPECIES: phosphate ABC transporter permease PstA [unclassified Sulfurimonas]OHE07291.1 MAG: phosphate ABC transporter, permease protein PstA [Sulfurimonas sp. RIFCSPLOWO2_12_FULL_34_6]OHE09758.1 MAG: phosphate ABC transporter, permease protein PstA [Sulfurimonas sp. RIFOXYD12_FULL_33_39]OHE13734.1 MAG: phosphate ABC transporter, permease protein PstA [Sulfurimonas sp. RIFOXYD2_FULL_34_21]DAB27945.1 MAG TPA: phosphate ABC transporter, permease protein PstA [Sulfurimonas sp. UBA10385]
MTHTQKRILINNIVMVLSTLSAIIGICFLLWILSVLVANGLDAISATIFMQEGAPPGNINGGLKHALIGQLIIVSYATLFGVPFGILAGTYLSEYGQKSKLAEIIRDISDIMMSAPSIVIGAFVYAIVVAPMGHFSGWAGSIALTIIMIPIILRTTDDMLQLVPSTLREAAFALGAPKYKVIIQVVYRGAKAGILTGILLGVARVAGETAPLLFTSFNNNFLNTNMSEPMASLTVTIYNYATSPYEDWQKLGWAAAFILSMFILTLNILGRLFLLKKKGK